MLRAKLLVAALLIGLYCLPPVLSVEVPPSEKLVGLLEKTEVLGTGQKVVVKVSGSEAVVSTYRHKESKDIDTDCKIDATLIAKELMISNDFGLRHVTVDFHEPDLIGSYREVVVTFAEIKGFAAGVVQKGDFLSSLTLTNIPERKTAPPDKENKPSTGVGAENTTASSSITPGSTSVSAVAPSQTVGAGNGSQNSSGTSGNSAPTNTKLGSSSAKKAEANPRYVSKYAGISFEIPKGWTVEDRFPPGGDLFFKLHSAQTKMSNIEFGIRRSGARNAAQCALSQKKRFTYDGVRFEKYETSKFGLGKYDGALVILQYPHSSNEQYYDMHLYFGKPNAILDLWGWCPISDYGVVGAAYNQVINTMSFPGGAGGGANPKNSAANKKH